MPVTMLGVEDTKVCQTEKTLVFTDISRGGAINIKPSKLSDFFAGVRM